MKYTLAQIKTISKKSWIALSLALTLIISVVGAAVFADDMIATLRSDTPLTEEDKAPAITPFTDNDQRLIRNYPEQPPIIPHDIEGYQVDLHANKCLSCHSRARIRDSGAPMVSITHYMDREGQFLATVSPRRFFCTQCHVPQHQSEELVENTFIDIDDLLYGKPENHE